MAEMPPIKVRFDVDTSGLKAAMDNVQSTISAPKLGVMGVAAGTALGQGIAGATTAAMRGVGNAVDYLQGAIGSASDLNETISKTSVLFGDAATPALEKWADGAASAFGASKQQALDAAGTFAIFGQGAGLAGSDLQTFSTDLTALSGDLASFYNTSTDDAITAIGAALRGESEPIRRYGVLLDDATLKARAMQMGIYNGTGALSQQQRVMAAQAEIMAQTSVAQGDYARTADGLANTQRSFQAELENTKSEIGTAFLPIMLDLMNAFKDALPGLKDALIPALKDMGASFRDNILPAIIQALPVITQIFSFIANNIGPITALVGVIGTLSAIVKVATVIQGAFNLVLLANPVMLVVAAIAALVAGLVWFFTQTETGKKMWEGFAQGLADFFNGVGEWAAGAWTAISDWFGGIAEWINGLGPAIADAARNIWTGFVNAALDVLMALPNMVADIMSNIPFLSDFGKNLKGNLGTMKAKVSGMLTGNSSHSSVVNNNYNVQARGLTVGQVQQDAARRTRRNAPVMGY